MSYICNMKPKEEILYAIKNVVAQVMPTGAQVILFGSQARGDAHENSDWDILILINEERVYNEDFDRVAFPLIELGWSLGIEVNPLIYTYNDWEKRHFTPFYKNIAQEGIEIWH